MKLIIAGGRDIWDYQLVKSAIQHFKLTDKITEIVCGKGDGIDSKGAEYAALNHIKLVDFEPDWDDITVPGAVIRYNRYGKPYNAAAGPIRNGKMAEYADALLLIWNGTSSGSKSMKEHAERVGIPIYEVILCTTNT